MSTPGMTNNPDGAPEYAPTKSDRQMVIVLSGLKVPQKIMAEKLNDGLGIDARTLRKHFQPEMEYGREHLIGSLKALIVQSAMKGSVRAQTWLLERLDPEQFAPRYTLPPGSGLPSDALIPLTDGDAKVSIYLPDNGRSAAEVASEPPEIDGEVSES